MNCPHQETINVRVMERNALKRENRASRFRQMGLGKRFQIRFVKPKLRGKIFLLLAIRGRSKTTLATLK